MSEKYYSLTQLKSIMRTKGNQWTGPYEIIHPDDLKKLKPANVRPVKEGCWIENRTDYICSACGGVVSDEIVYMLQSEKLPDYCPYCGTKLRQEPT